jgi:hypothetical protein
MDRTFSIELRDYEAGTEPDELTTARIEKAIEALLATDGSDGVVIVQETTE